MKKTYSFNIEEDILERIEKYKVEHNLSSRSGALERMILKLDTLDLLDLDDKIKKIITNIIKENNQEIEVSTKSDLNKNLDKSINNVFADMPD